jgi:hypothetical protein
MQHRAWELVLPSKELVVRFSPRFSLPLGGRPPRNIAIMCAVTLALVAVYIYGLAEMGPEMRSFYSS